MRALRKVVIRGIEYQDLSYAAQALDIGPETLLKELHRKPGERWHISDDDYFVSDPPPKEPAKETPAEPHKEIHVSGGPPTGGPGISDYELARRRRIYFLKVQPFQTDDEKPPGN